MLEAAHILGTARSFRSGQAKSIITHGETRLVVYGEKAIAEGGQRAIGVQRELPGEITLKVAGAPTRSVAPGLRTCLRKSEPPAACAQVPAHWWAH